MDTASLRPGSTFTKSPGAQRTGPPSSLWFLSFCPRTLDPSILWSGSAPCPRSQPVGGAWALRRWPLTAGWRSQLCPLCSSSPSCSQKWNHSLWRGVGDVLRCVSREKNKNRSSVITHSIKTFKKWSTSKKIFWKGYMINQLYFHKNWKKRITWYSIVGVCHMLT